MALLPTGTTQTDNLIFNSGILTANGLALADLDNIAITQEVDIKDLFVLGSIKSRAKRRSQLKISFKATVKSYNMALLQYFYGSSATDSGAEDYFVVDGQQPAITGLAVTCYIGTNTAQPVQFQFTNPVIKSIPFNLKANEFADGDIEIEATDLTVYNGASSL